jgi:hypothetical protein
MGVKTDDLIFFTGVADEKKTGKSRLIRQNAYRIGNVKNRLTEKEAHHVE